MRDLLNVSERGKDAQENGTRFPEKNLAQVISSISVCKRFSSVYALSRFQTERSSESTVVSFQCL